MESSKRFDALILNVNYNGGGSLVLGNNVVGQGQFDSSSCGCNNKSLPTSANGAQRRPTCNPRNIVVEHGSNCEVHQLSIDCNWSTCFGHIVYDADWIRSCKCNASPVMSSANIFI